MAALKPSELKFSTPTRASFGSWYISAVNVEFPSAKEVVGTEGTEGELEIPLSKFALPDETVFGGSEGFGQLSGGLATVGETATTTAPPFLVWCSNLVEAKTAAETGKNIKKMFPCEVTLTKGKLQLRIFQNLAAKKESSEVTEAEKANAVPSLCRVTIFVCGK